ncbi:MAG: LPS-assembly protein LptD [Alphaproteobacteria bacterium]|nr:LPS-assembly protein LptD [Alphaproteobacteria bacterium]
MKPAAFSHASALRSSLALSAVLLSMASTARADIEFVQENVLPRTKIDIKQPVSNDEPVMLSADTIDYEQNNEVVVATGNVEVNQKDTILLADQVIYDRKLGTVTAHGNISVLEPSGNVYFADDIELKNELQAGVVKQFKTRLIDDSLLTSASATRRDENVTEMVKATYSPCKLNCQKPGDASAPIWQISAENATMNKTKEKVTYDNAFFELFGLPVLYTPYFSHQLPGAANKSGLLKPEYEHTSNLGTVFKLPAYYSIAPDKDVTITPVYVGNEKPVLEGEYRQMFNTGNMKFNGSITNPQARDDAGALTKGNDLRGHLDAKGEFRPTDATKWGFDVHRTSDDTYLRRYRYNDSTLLNSRAYAEKTDFIKNNSRNFASVQAVSFQGLTAADKGKRIPFAFPLADFNYQSDAGKYDSRFSVDSNAMILHRQNGADSRRLSSTVGWKLPYITEGGQMIEFNTQVRSDIYRVDQVSLSNGNTFDGTTGRVVPQADVLWRYPFINNGKYGNLMIEPVVNLAVSPSGGNPEKIPNEDSLVPEFTDSNLFSPNRFAGYDRVESGPRASYGLRGQAQIMQDKYIDMLVGQNYHINNDPTFPFSNNPDDHFSDYVGKIGITSGPVMLAYRTRLDKETLATKRNELNAGVAYKPVAVSVSYLSLNKDPVLASKKEVSGAATLDITDEWSLLGYGSKDLQLDQTNSAYGGATFKNECISISTVVGKEFTRDRDIKPSTNVLVKLSLKNLN